MKRQRLHITLLLIVALAFSATAQTPTAKPQHYKNLKYPKLRELQIPEPTRFELANGMIVYLLEDHTLPTINASAMVRTGSRYEPADKVGLASLTGQVMRTGGTTSKTGEEIDQMLERAAASVETFIGSTSGGARLSVLKEDFDMGLGVLADILKNPAFREDKIDLAKVSSRSGISRRNDQVDAIAGREFNRLIYGTTSPYGRLMEYVHVENITKQDLIDFHRRYFLPNAMMIAVWGDFSTAAMKSKIEGAFGDWARGTMAVPPAPQARMATARTVNFIKKTDVNQSQIYIGHLGGKLNDPESALLNLADKALGGGQASRLFSKIRSEQGLAYAVWSFWGESYDYQGAFSMGGSTKSGTTVAMVKSILKEFEGAVTSGITESELRYAKESFLNSFVFEFDTKAKVINKLMTLEYYGYPKDYYQKQQQAVQNATLKAVNEAMQKRWKPEVLSILVVGNDGEFDAPLSSLGAVKTIDITIPSPPEKIPDATPETLAKGKELLKKTLAAMGGPQVATLKDMVTTVKLMQSTPMGDIAMDAEMKVVMPNKFATRLKSPMGEMTMAFDGIGGWVQSPMGTQDMPGSLRENFQKQRASDMHYLLQNFEKAEYQIQYLKEEAIEGKPMSVVFIRYTPTNYSFRYYIDTKSGLFTRKVAKGNTPGGPADIEENYSDYRPVNGVQIPYKTEASTGGKKVSELTIVSATVNTGVKDDVFKKP